MLEKPFARIPQLQMARAERIRARPGAGRAVCAVCRPGSRGDRGRRRHRIHRAEHRRIDVSFAIGAALPLLFFALAGQRVAERVGTFRRHQRGIRMIGGIVMLVLRGRAGVQRARQAAASHPRLHQRAAGQGRSASDEIQEKLNLGGLVNDQNRELSNCTNGAPSSKVAAPHRISKASTVG